MCGGLYLVQLEVPFSSAVMRSVLITMQARKGLTVARESMQVNICLGNLNNGRPLHAVQLHTNLLFASSGKHVRL